MLGIRIPSLKHKFPYYCMQVSHGKQCDVTYLKITSIVCLGLSNGLLFGRYLALTSNFKVTFSDLQDFFFKMVRALVPNLCSQATWSHNPLILMPIMDRDACTKKCWWGEGEGKLVKSAQKITRLVNNFQNSLYDICFVGYLCI